LYLTTKKIIPSPVIDMKLGQILASHTHKKKSMNKLLIRWKIVQFIDRMIDCSPSGQSPQRNMIIYFVFSQRIQINSLENYVMSCV
jgi:hypothetical protein